MDKLYAAAINEIEKLYRKRSVKAFLILDIIIALCAGLMLSALQYKIGIFAVNASTLPVLTLELFTNFFLPLFIIMTASEVFSGEEGSKTMKLSVSRPITRLKIFTAKFAALAFYIILSLIFIALASILSQVFIRMPGNSLLNFLLNLITYGAALFPLLILASFAVFMAQFFKSSGTSMAVSLVVYIGAKIISFIFPKASTVLFTSYMNWHSYSHSITLFFLVLSYGIIFLTCGYYLFDRKDF